MHRPLAGKRIDAAAEARGVVRRLHRHASSAASVFFTACSKSCASSTPSMSVRVSTLAREHRELVAELGEREVLRRHQGRGRAAQARRFGKAEFLRPEAGERRQALAQRVQARELRLHLAQLDRHRVEVLLHEGAVALGFGLAAPRESAAAAPGCGLGGVAQRQPVQAHGRDSRPPSSRQRPLPTRCRDDSETDLAFASRSEIRIICTTASRFSIPVRLSKLDRILSAERDLQPLVSKARELARASGLVQRFLSADLASQVRVVNLREGEIVLSAAHSAAAAKLRLLAPSLCRFLSNQRWQVSSVRSEGATKRITERAGRVAKNSAVIHTYDRYLTSALRGHERLPGARGARATAERRGALQREIVPAPRPVSTANPQVAGLRT